jgi:Flp pilus assembly pilin Flp
MKGGSMNTSILKALWREEDGQDLIEYALLMAFIALAAVTVLGSLKTNIQGLWNSISDALVNAVAAS